jgi:hypothetical protein
MRILISALLLGLVLLPGAALAQEEKAEHDLEAVLIETANTPAQHAALAQHFRDKAAWAREEAAAHKTMEKSYAMGRKMYVGEPPGKHCTNLAAQFETMAKEYDALAASHEAAAKK